MGLSATHQPGRTPNKATRNAEGVNYVGPARTRNATRKGVKYAAPVGIPSGPQCKASTRHYYKECHVQRGRGQIGRPCENAKSNAEGVNSAVPKGIPSGSQCMTSTHYASICNATDTSQHRLLSVADVRASLCSVSRAPRFGFVVPKHVLSMG